MKRMVALAEWLTATPLWTLIGVILLTSEVAIWWRDGEWIHLLTGGILLGALVIRLLVPRQEE